MSTRPNPDKKSSKPDKADAARAHALDLYQSALLLMQQGKFERAHTAFTKLAPIAPPEIAERVRMYLTACAQQLAANKNTFATPGEHYDDARHELDAILKKHSKYDEAFYGLALLAALTGDSESCLQQLAEAISLNPRYRIQARSDPDFQEMFDDPRFTELLYPES